MSDFTLLQGDCLDILPTLEAGSVDAVITDPPYEVTVTDLTLPRPYTDALEAGGWGFDHAWLGEVARLLKPGGAWYVFMNDEGWSPLKARAKEFGLYPAARMVWIKSNPKPSTYSRCWRSGTELIMYGTKGRSPAYFAKRTQRELLPHFTLPIVRGKVRTAHPTQKPVAPIAFWIDTSCPPGGLVLDPFMGSGTTGVACVNTGRNFIGIERDAGYFEIAQRRIAEAASARQGVLL